VPGRSEGWWISVHQIFICKGFVRSSLLEKVLGCKRMGSTGCTLLGCLGPSTTATPFACLPAFLLLFLLFLLLRGCGVPVATNVGLVCGGTCAALSEMLSLVVECVWLFFFRVRLRDILQHRTGDRGTLRHGKRWWGQVP
jgi:hypothetical protein